MQKYNNNSKVIIGLDHGYGNMKTAHRVFRSGVEYSEQEPIVSTNYVKYKNGYYVIGESHLVYQGKKTESNDFLILTMAALAEELKFRGLHDANVILAVGLPLAWAKSQSSDFKKYLMQSTELNYDYRKEHYHVHLCGVEIFPQGFAAICNKGTMQGIIMNCLMTLWNDTMPNKHGKIEKWMITMSIFDKEIRRIYFMK